ncbi:hypothetical protein CB1_000331047 [Camelus ferus]|nr:hypothetical protein CB1_000331047 [Camelus ferus]
MRRARWADGLVRQELRDGGADTPTPGPNVSSLVPTLTRSRQPHSIVGTVPGTTTPPELIVVDDQEPEVAEGHVSSHIYPWQMSTGEVRFVPLGSVSACPLQVASP